MSPKMNDGKRYHDIEITRSKKMVTTRSRKKDMQIRSKEDDVLLIYIHI